MKKNVLIFPAGEINSVELHDSLAHNVNVSVYGASSVDRHGEFVFKNYRGNLPFITAKEFIDEFNNLIDEWKIDFIFPTHDTIALFLAEKQELIHAKVIVASKETAMICRDKKETYDLFKDCIFCPNIYSDIKTFPVFIKPREGQGAQGAALIKSKEDIPLDLDVKNYVISEYLPGKELTVDCVTDSKGRLCACLPRERNRLLAGVCVAGETIETSKEILTIAREINARLEFLGLWYFQIKQDENGRYKLLEIATRCAGTMCLSRARGVNLPLLSVYASMGYELNVFENPINVRMDRTLISRYFIDYDYDKVYIDYDDTIIEEQNVNPFVLSFLYQCKNKGKKIILVSRHEVDHYDTIEESLEKHALSISIFDEIIKLNEEQKKSDFILDKHAIFIDNAYSERKLVHDCIGIPVFDVEGIEVLTDWRC